MPASDADVALARRAFEDFVVSPDQLEEYWERFFTPDAVVEPVDAFPVPGRYQGVDEFRRWFEESYGPYEDVDRRLDAVRAEGDVVVALYTVSGRERADSVQLQVELGNVYELEGDRIKYLRVYVGHERALAMARGD